MGGYGSGRWGWHSKKNTVEESKCLEISWLSKQGYFSPGWKYGDIKWKNASGQVTSTIGIVVSINDQDLNENYVRFIYTSTNTSTKEATKLDYKAELVTTSCNFGGVRYWFICPLIINGRACRRRVSKLYLASGSKYFGCRHCHNLTYTSCQEHDKRIDALAKNPEMLLAKLNSNDLGNSLLTIKACYKVAKKQERR